MNYKEYLEFRKNIDLTRFKDFGNLNLYEAIPGPILKDISLGHCNGNVHRCHLAEDFCRVMNIEYKTRENMAISYGVRDCLNIMMSVYKHHKWILPSDTYPFYQKTANLHNVEYCQYETLGKKDIIYPEGDILLICFPSKPSGRILSLKEIEDIYKWKKQSSHRMVIVDCAYCIKITEHIKMMQSYDFTLLFSLSKIWSHPNIMGLAILSNNNLEIRNIFIQRKMDKIKMHQAYNLINKDTYFIQDMIRILNTKLEKLTDFKIKTQNNIPGYLFYSHRNFQDYLNQGILTIPTSVYGGNKGVIFSTL